MEAKISVEQSVPITTRDGKEKRMEHLDITVGNDDVCHEGVMTIKFYNGDYFPSFPVSEWANIKNLVDQMIIKAEHLVKEDC